MLQDNIKPQNIDEYISSFSAEVQEQLKQMRETVRAAAPDADEAIKYGIPTFVLKGNLVHFAAYKKHIGFYPTPKALEVFRVELAGYKTSKGAVQFPLHEPLPLSVMQDIVRFRAKQNLDKT